MTRIPSPSAAVMAARGRRAGQASARNVRIEWLIKEVMNKVTFTMKQRVTLATAMVKDQVVRNIGRPVTKGKGPRGGRVVTDRSKPGEYPKVETSQLQKTIFSVVKQTRKGMFDGFIGTPLDYGVILELKMNRSFLVRTLTENKPMVRKILTGPIR